MCIDSSSEELQISDFSLIEWLKKNYKSIEFINFDLPNGTYHRNNDIANAINNIDDVKSTPLHQQRDKILTLWKPLLGNAIAFLKSKDEREMYHDDEDYGVERLHEFFEAFYKFEALSYGAKEYYRDHVTHVFKVFLLGMRIISKKLKFENVKLGTKDFSEINVSASEKEAMWCIMSLTHDLGYALEIIPEINKKARNMLNQFGNINVQELSYTFPRQPLSDFLINFISSDLQEIKKEECSSSDYITHIQSKYFLKFSGAFERHLHGIISCIVLMRNLVYFLESDLTLDDHKPLKNDDAKHFLIRNNILRSIASHDCDDIYYLSVDQFPFLLRIFDEMQEWERPHLSDLFTEKIPDTTLLVRELNQEKVHYEIEMKLTHPETEEIDKLKANVRGYFKKKCERIRRILRSAAGGKLRKFILIFEVVDRIGEKVDRYKIVHTNPSDVKIFVNDTLTDWTKL